MKRFLRIAVIILGLVFAILLIAPFLLPIPPLEDTHPPEQLADSDGRFASIGALRVHYKTRGDGEPAFVLLHGFGASVFSWREVMQPLSEISRVTAFDRPAFGLTSRPMPDEWGSDNPYGPEFQADLTIALMDTLGIETAILVGHSAGGSGAVLTALNYPERVQALILVAPAVSGGGRFGGIPNWLLQLPQVRHLGPLLVRSIAIEGEQIIFDSWHDPSRVTQEILDGYKLPLQADNWDRALYEYTAASHALNLDQRFDELRLPIMIITGDNDRIVATERSIRLADELPNAELVVIPDCGHLPHEECPTAFLNAVTDFISRLP